MLDRLIFGGVAVLVISLVALAFGGAVLAGYRGIFELVTGHMALGMVKLGATVPLGLAGWMLLRHRDDLLV